MDYTSFQTGDLVRTMGGSGHGSTDVHLAASESLLAGLVTADSIVDSSDFRSKKKMDMKMQMWDFASGRAFEMPYQDICTASCMLSDGERIALAGTIGNTTQLTVWDMMGNQPIKELGYTGPDGFCDTVTFLGASKDDKFVAAGFTSNYDGNAHFLIFDLKPNPHPHDPMIFTINAEPDCTQILDGYEAITGTRDGELTIWSLKTGKALRHLFALASPHTSSRLGGSSTIPHVGPVTSMAVSNDGSYLVSASADHTLKVWDMKKERNLHTLRGHVDEVSRPLIIERLRNSFVIVLTLLFSSLYS
jgi:leucine-rich repeat transmembrane neuronal protein 1/2